MTEANNTDLIPLKMVGPLPLFWGENSDAMENIEAAGYNDYYIVALEGYSVPVGTSGNATKVEYRSTIFRVSATQVGRAVVPATPQELDLFCASRKKAEWSMPLMPWSMVQKMDQFFRKVFDKLGTEAILMLTYDVNYFGKENASEGWNCIAPDQENTAGHCNYDPPTVQKYKTDDEIIVGTIHSHPEMNAFFSGTDHKDQDDWDGLHITQAWRGKGPTEYHISFILGGQEWELKQDEVFDKPPLPVVDTTDVEEWVERVQKKIHQTTSTTSYGWEHGAGRSSSSSPYNAPIPLPTQGMMPRSKVRTIVLPENAPDPRNTVIIPEYPLDIVAESPASTKCRLCNAPLLSRCVDARHCMACSAMMVLEDETVNDLVQYRAANNYPYRLEIDPERSTHAIVIWKLDGSFETVRDLEGATDSPK